MVFGVFLGGKKITTMFDFRYQLKKVIPNSFGFAIILFLFLFFSGLTDLVVRQVMLIVYSILFYFLIQFLVMRKQFQFKKLSENLGGMSYALYALHAPLVILMIELKIRILILIPVIFITTWLVFLYFEKPLRKYGLKIATKSI
jgi:peptidoglycan/LPS O-acetylase OafA/YrhL